MAPPPQIEVTYPDGSPADGVKVRVKAELTPKDNVYASELTSRNGRATFEIPSIPTSAQYVWLEVSGSRRPRGLILYYATEPEMCPYKYNSII